MICDLSPTERNDLAKELQYFIRKKHAKILLYKCNNKIAYKKHSSCILKTQTFVSITFN